MSVIDFNAFKATKANDNKGPTKHDIVPDLSYFIDMLSETKFCKCKTCGCDNFNILEIKDEMLIMCRHCGTPI